MEEFENMGGMERAVRAWRRFQGLRNEAERVMLAAVEADDDDLSAMALRLRDEAQRAMDNAAGLVRERDGACEATPGGGEDACTTTSRTTGGTAGIGRRRIGAS